MGTLTLRSAVSGLKTVPGGGRSGSTWHLHQCSDRTCRRPFPHACADPLEERTAPELLTCFYCRGMAGGWPQIYSFYLPHACCGANSQQVTDPAQIRTYKLAGFHPWFQCRACFRVSGWPSPIQEVFA